MARKNWIKAFISRLSANLWAQRQLQKGVLFAQNLMGIGEGASPSWSGEKRLADLLRRAQASATSPVCAFDVGSNRGQFLAGVLLPLQSSGVSVEIHAFEPGRPAYDALSRQFGGRPGIHLNNFALGESEGEVDLYANGPGSSMSSLSHRRLDHFGVKFDYSERIRIRRLDDYCEEQRLQRIDLLKLDVEGHELDVLRGSTRMLGEGRIGAISFEFGGCNIDSRTYFQDFWYFFRQHGPANINRLTPSGLLVPITAYSEDLEQFRTTNYLVILPQAQAAP